MSNKDKYLLIIGLLAYGIWGAAAFFYDNALVSDFMMSVKAIALGVVAIVVRDMQPTKNANGDAQSP